MIDKNKKDKMLIIAEARRLAHGGSLFYYLIFLYFCQFHNKNFTKERQGYNQEPIS